MQKVLVKKKNLLSIKNRYRKFLLLYLLIKYKYFINKYNNDLNISRQWYNKFLDFQKKKEYKFLSKFSFFNKFFFFLIMLYPSVSISYKYLKIVKNNYKNYFLFLKKIFLYFNKKNRIILKKNKLYEFRSFYYVVAWYLRKPKKVYFDKCVTDKYLIIKKKKKIYKYNFLKFFFIINSNKALIYFLLKACLNFNIFYKLYYIKNFPFLNHKIYKRFLIMDGNRYSPVFVLNYNKRYNYVNLFNFSKSKIKETYNRYVKNFYFMFFKLNLNNKIFKFSRKKEVRLFKYGIDDAKVRKDIFPLRFYRNKLKFNFFFNMSYLYFMLKRNKIKYCNKYSKYDKLHLLQIFSKNNIVKNVFEDPKYYLQDNVSLSDILKQTRYHKFLNICSVYNLNLIYQINLNYKKNISYYFIKNKNNISFLKNDGYIKVYFKNIYLYEMYIKNEYMFFSEFLQFFYLNMNKFKFDNKLFSYWKNWKIGFNKLSFLKKRDYFFGQINLKKVISEILKTLKKFFNNFFNRYNIKFKYLNTINLKFSYIKLLFLKIVKKLNFLSKENKKIMSKFFKYFIKLFNKNLVYKLNNYIKNKKEIHNKTNKFSKILTIIRGINYSKNKIIDKNTGKNKKFIKFMRNNKFFIFNKSGNKSNEIIRFININKNINLNEFNKKKKNKFNKSKKINKFFKLYQSNDVNKVIKFIKNYRENKKSILNNSNKKFFKNNIEEISKYSKVDYFKGKFSKCKANKINRLFNNVINIYIKKYINNFFMKGKEISNIFFFNIFFRIIFVNNFVNNFNKNFLNNFLVIINRMFDNVKMNKIENVWNNKNKIYKIYSIYSKIKEKKKYKFNNFYMDPFIFNNKIVKKYNFTKKLYFIYFKLYNLYFYWYIYFNNNYLKLLNIIMKFIWYSFFFLFNKIDFFFLELYFKNINYFFIKSSNNNYNYKYSIFNYFINSNNLFKDINNFLIKKVSINWFYLSKRIYVLRGLVSIFDNIKRSYKIWMVKKRKKLSLFLPFFIYNSKNFYNKKIKGKNFYNKKIKGKNFNNKNFIVKKSIKINDIKNNLLNYYNSKIIVKNKKSKKLNLMEIFLKKEPKIGKSKNFYYKNSKGGIFSKKKLNVVNLII